MTPVIFLDMDGVVVDFFSQMCKAHHLDPVEAFTRLQPKDWWFTSVLGPLTEGDFWGAINTFGEEFWSEANAYPYARQLYDELCKLAPVYFCSHPSLQPNCASGKLKWLQKFLPPARHDDYVFTKHKRYLAKQNHVLIDDADYNCEHFMDAGGAAIMFPRRWNKLYEISDRGEAVDYTLRMAKTIVSFISGMGDDSGRIRQPDADQPLCSLRDHT
jgi:5'(3')-deoxyribonucleotidase